MSLKSKEAGIPTEKYKLIEKYSNILSNRNLNLSPPKIRTRRKVYRRNILDPDISKENEINTTETNVQSVPTVNILELNLSPTKTQSSSKPEGINSNTGILTHRDTNIIETFSVDLKVKESAAKIITRRCSARNKNASTKNESNKVTSQSAKKVGKSNDKLCVDSNGNELPKLTEALFEPDLIENKNISLKVKQNAISSKTSNPICVIKLDKNEILSALNNLSKTTNKNEHSPTFNVGIVECSKQVTSKSSKNSKASNNDNLTKYKTPNVMSTEETNIVPETETSQAVNKLEAATKNASEGNINFNRISQTCNRNIHLNIDSDKVECDIKGIRKDALNINNKIVDVHNPEITAKNRQPVKSKPNSIKPERKSFLSSTKSNTSITKRYKLKKLSVALDRNIVDTVMNKQHKIIKSKNNSSIKLTTISNTDNLQANLEKNVDSADSGPAIVDEVNINSLVEVNMTRLKWNKTSTKGGSVSPTKKPNAQNSMKNVSPNHNDQIQMEEQINLVSNKIFNIDPKYATMIKPCSVVLEDCVEPVHIEPEIDINIETTVHACIPCNETYTTLKDLRKHVYTTHVSDTTNKCFICDVEITNKNKMTTHILTHMLTVIYICETCNAVTETQESYDEHMLTQHNSFVCDVCGKPCSSKNTLTKHKIVHQPDRYKCKVCSKIFGNARKLWRHMLIHGEKKFFCEICDATFCRREVLNDHVKMHSTERAYKCDFCSKTFTTKSTQYAHIRIHDETKQKKCEYCSKTFTTRQALLRHLYKHENVQLHQCNVCKNVYETLSEMKAHEQKHNGDLDTFQCRICGEVFISKVKLSHHREGCRDKNYSSGEVGSHWLI
ncbi:zinc finger protein 37-like isoform X1 [Ctenocephalides felis]|uniref:zinc finger protein 37-like isoform X1 n=1 Tax=Ctenocephalides felis TaxID=7515 RepID=UPI000E6E5832|nr:zinc finger protein 37-like isoform X1 [Ctenocephalides felis]